VSGIEFIAAIFLLPLSNDYGSVQALSKVNKGAQIKAPNHPCLAGK
jgi:hypothetical protein